MLIAIDGACKRNGQPECISCGVCWIIDDMHGLCKVELHSTSQRGEIIGLLSALDYAQAKLQSDEDLIIITDSEYLLNTISLDWCFKWKKNNWIAGSGEPAKNADLWGSVCNYLNAIGKERVFMQWTKGHLISYTPGNTKRSMEFDNSGLDLMSKIQTIINRPSERQRIIDEFNKERVEHKYDAVPDDVALQWVSANIIADLIAVYTVNRLNDKLDLQNTILY